MVCCVNAKSVDRIIYSTFQRFNLESKPAPSEFLNKQLDAPLRSPFAGETSFVYSFAHPTSQSGNL